MEHLEHILFLDIETVSAVFRMEDLSSSMQRYWTRKAQAMRHQELEQDDVSLLYREKSGIYSEFLKIVCISVGSFVETPEGRRFRIKSLTGDDEKILLNEFVEILNRFAGHAKSRLRLCGHNLREFDLPVLCRRMTIHELELPEALQMQGKRPWEVKHIEDTLELWRFGDFKNYTALGLLAEILGIPTPKEDMDGSMVSSVYHEEHDLRRIARYCSGDVITTAKVFLRLKGLTGIAVEPLFLDE